MADYGKFQLGGVVYPVEDSPFIKALPKLDPPIYKALVYYKAMLEKHLGAYFDALVTDAGMADYAGKIVAEYVGYDPAPYLQAAQYKFPLLALYRTEEEVKDHTVAWYKAQSQWTLLYVLPTLTAAQANQVVHILKGIRAVIADRTIQGYDPDYNSGEEVWETAGVMSIGITTARYGTIPDLSTNILFPALELTMNVEEREEKNPGLDTFSGIDGEVKVSDGTPANEVTVAEFEWSTP